MLFRQQCTEFSCTMLSESLGHCITQGFYLCNFVPRVLRQNWTGFFSVHCCLEPHGQHCTRFLPVQCCPKSIKTTLNRIFSCALLSLEPQGQHCIGYLTVQCCPRSIKTTLNKIFPVQCCLEPLRQHCTKFTCAMLSQKY